MALENRALAIDSTWDDNTMAATDYRRRNVHPYLNARGIPVEELAGVDANHAKAEREATTKGIAYITGVSHGTGDCFAGDQDRPVFQIGAYDLAAVRKKIVHFLACNTALYLGRNLIDPGGAAAFFGYIGPFAWPVEAGGAYEELFFDCDAEIDRALADGDTAFNAGKRAIDKFDEQIAALRANGDTASVHAAAVLEHTRDLLRGPHSGREYGDGNATVKKVLTVANGGP